MLQEYKRKRDFEKTPEPSGAEKSASQKGMKQAQQALTFVIQKHAASRLHYDFRLEIDGVMVSWAVPKGPSTSTSDKRLAVMTEDHPMEYSSFEGLIPAHQYGAGEVIIWDHGTYSPDEDKVYSWDNKEDANKRMRAGIKKGKLSFYLRGEKLEGSWTLIRLHGKEKEWLLIKHHDEFENTSRDVTKEDASVVSGLTLEDLQEGGANRIWTSKGEQKADPKTTGKSTNKKNAAKSDLKHSPSSEVKKKSQSKEKAEVKALLETAKNSAFPKEITPMLATLADAPFTSKGWFFEPKLDGVRAIAYIRNGGCTLTSRNHNDLTGKYPAIAKAMSHYEKDYVFDGEVVALDEKGRPSFQHLQQSGIRLRAFSGRQTADSKALLFYYVFDILYADGKDLTPLTVVERKKILSHALQTNETIQLVGSLGNDGMAAYQACVDNKLEGIVGKREDSIYEKGSRSKAWLKVKTNLSGEFLICGFTEGTGSRHPTFGSLLLGEFDDKGDLQYVGGVGTGFDAKKLAALLKRMKPLETKDCPFKKKPTGKLSPTWLRPQIVVEIKYLERTQDNILRAPVYLHTREDIRPANVKETPVVHVEARRQAQAKPRSNEKKSSNNSKSADNSLAEVVLEQLDNDKEKINLEIEDNVLALSSLNKIYWPAHDDQDAITKRDYLRYLAQVSEYVIPHLTDRMITLVRFPNGINESRFYQKHWEKNLPEFVKTTRVYTEHEKRDQDFLVCNNLSTLLWLGQIADLELHTSHTRANQEPDGFNLPVKATGNLENLKASIMNYPDYVVLDLDPYLYSGKEKKGEEPELHRKGFEKCCEIAFYMKEHLDNLKLETFIKTSGKTGLHIYIPIRRNIDYDTVRTLSEVICTQILKEHPNEVTMDWAVIKRTGKVFMDHNMNARSKSLASIYSPRVSPDAGVSTPLQWSELNDVYPTDFTLRTMPDRLAKHGDLWANILDHKHDLTVLLSKNNSTVAEKKSRRK